MLCYQVSVKKVILVSVFLSWIRHIKDMQDLKKLIDKYSIPGPRYTSYPPVPFWTGAPDESQWIGQIATCYSPDQGVDLYVHVPFCEKLCYYCGCNRTITRNHSVEDPFVQMVIQEWEIYKNKLGFYPKVNSLHFGGGTPTFLSPENLSTLITNLTANRTHNFVGSIEIDPRTCSVEHLKVLADTGISRVSLGIQDFDPEVQKSINRFQPVSMVEQLVEKLREYKFKSVNFDLIYGLPKQSIDSITTTMSIVARLRPDLIAFYGYAHLPERIKNQRLINENDLPSAQMRRELYESGKEILKGYGYSDIGMDHFALPGSYLYNAKMSNNLHRNFMGYVDRKSNILIGLGPTSISDSSEGFAQNSKELSDYEIRIKAGNLPIQAGHIHTSEDIKVQDVILKLMCDGEVHFNQNDIPRWNDVHHDLKSFEADGIITLTDDHLKLTDLGVPFLRNVAMSFDYRLRQKTSSVKFSQTV